MPAFDSKTWTSGSYARAGAILVIAVPLVVRRFAWFPKKLKKLPDYSKALHVFEKHLQAHDGVSARPLVEARARAPRSILAHIGLKALRDADRARARSAFARAIKVDPYRVKNYLRWMRACLPTLWRSACRALETVHQRVRPNPAARPMWAIVKPRSRVIAIDPGRPALT